MWLNLAFAFTLIPFILGNVFDCPPGQGYKFYAPDKRCIHYADSSVKMNYSEAVAYCANLAPIDEFGTKPRLIEVKDESHLVLTTDPAYVDINTNYWVGLSDRYSEGQFVYETSGEVFSDGFNPWSTGEPKNFNGKEDCVGATTDNLHFWSAENCNLEFSPICDAFEYFSKCPPGYEYVESVDRCYGIFGDTVNPSTFQVANQTCKDNGGYLIEILNREQETAIVNLPQALLLRLKWFWMGITDALFEGEFIWLEARATTENYSNWNYALIGGALGGDPVSKDDDCAYIRWIYVDWINCGCDIPVGNYIMCETNRNVE